MGLTRISLEMDVEQNLMSANGRDMMSKVKSPVRALVSIRFQDRH